MRYFLIPKGFFSIFSTVMVLILTPLFTKDTPSHRRLILRLTHPIFFPSSSTPLPFPSISLSLSLFFVLISYLSFTLPFHHLRFTSTFRCHPSFMSFVYSLLTSPLLCQAQTLRVMPHHVTQSALRDIVQTHLICL